MNNLFIIPIEPIETRYTSQWYEYLPRQIYEFLINNKIEDIHVITIDGEELKGCDTTDGAFLNFSSTNIWKNSQANTIAKMFQNNEIQDGDYFLYTDAWNPTVLELKYMSELFGVDIKIGGMWHAGSYDRYDFLGRKIVNKSWSYGFERTLYHTYDHNFFATEYHSELFRKELFTEALKPLTKNYVVGWPMEYLKEKFENEKNDFLKENLVIFPHRLAPEKNIDLFREVKEIAEERNLFKCSITIEETNSKEEYYQYLKRAKIVFSANLQETLGIGVYEGLLNGALPVVPDRLSYIEMYPIRYPTDIIHPEEIVEMLELKLVQYDRLIGYFDKDKISKFFNGRKLYETIINSMR